MPRSERKWIAVAVIGFIVLVVAAASDGAFDSPAVDSPAVDSTDSTSSESNNFVDDGSKWLERKQAGARAEVKRERRRKRRARRHDLSGPRTVLELSQVSGLEQGPVPVVA
jgi:hypothetical protein